MTSGNVVTHGNNSPAITAIAGAGNVSVTTTGSTFTYGLASDGIYAETVNSGNVLLTNSGHIDAFDGVGAHVASAGTATINNHSSIYGGYGGVVASSVNGTTINNSLGASISGGGGYAIGVSGGAAVINNAGHIFGYANTTANNDTVNNTGTWFAYGTSNFGAGTDTFNNGTNALVMVAPFSSTATAVTWNGLEVFNNSGLVDLRNGHTGDVFTLNADVGGTAFNGLAGSRLGVDASLSAALTSDKLVIGAAGGATALIVHDVSPGSPGAINLVGVTVVDGTSGSAGAFTWGGEQKGFVDYELSFNSANTTWNIVGLPGQAAFEMVKVPELAQGFWRRTGDAWSAREQEVRDSIWGSSPATRGEGWEMWAQAQVGGERLSSNQTFNVGGMAFTPDHLGTDTDWRGFQMGGDTRTAGDWMWGFTGGYHGTEHLVPPRQNSIDTTGWTWAPTPAGLRATSSSTAW